MKDLTRLDDDALCAGFRDTNIGERENLVDHLDYLIELDRRKLTYGHSTLKAFVVAEFQLDESVAAKRIKIARLLKRYPEIREAIANGKLGIKLIELALGYRHRQALEDDDFLDLLKSFEGKTYSAAAREGARRYPHSIELPHDSIRPFNETHAILRIAVPYETLEKMDRTREIHAHSHPEMTKAELIDIAFDDYNQRHHPAEKAKKPEKNPKNPVDPQYPDIVRFATDRQLRELVRMKGYRCWHEENGVRCTSTYGLEKDHIIEWADGGRTELSNLCLLCPGHHRRKTFLRHGAFASTP